MKTQSKQGFTLIELLVVITIIALLASLAMPVYTTVTEKGNITKGINNCRQILMAEKVYASDNNGRYTDIAVASGSTTAASAATEVADANTAFRGLFIAGVLSDERIFGCPASPFVPDGNIGTVSDSFAEAVAAGECHWAIMGGLNDSAPAYNPLVFENCSSAAADPTWTGAVGKSVAGRTWSGPSIIIGQNDGSVTKVKLSTSGNVKAPDPFTQGGTASAAGSNAPTAINPK